MAGSISGRGAMGDDGSRGARQPTLHRQLRVKFDDLRPPPATAPQGHHAAPVFLPRDYAEIRVARSMPHTRAITEGRPTMLAHTYSYEEVLHNSLKVAWKEEDVLRNRDF